MPRPPRTDEAREAVQAYYRQHRVMPTIEEVAELMGYRSTSSAHNAANALVKEGFLARSGRGGRLLPGPMFAGQAGTVRESMGRGSMPEGLRDSLPGDVPVREVQVLGPELTHDGVLPGDWLVIGPLALALSGAPIVYTRGKKFAIGDGPRSGWKSLGSLLAQYRNYRR